jgi:outer membrane protein OmpA-like peptidoglycan-associated protein
MRLWVCRAARVAVLCAAVTSWSSTAVVAEDAAPEPVDAAMRSIYFEPGQAAISDSFRPILRGNVMTIAEHPDWRYVVISGHCDAMEVESSAGCPDALRAEAVRSALVKLGANPVMLRTEKHGARAPAIHGDVEAARRYNRRVDFSAWH